MDHHQPSPEYQYLAWQGIQILMLSDWRPLRIEGHYENGAVTVGDQEGPIFILRWLHPPKKYDASKWIEKRQNKIASGQISNEPPMPDRFDSTSWIKDLAIREEAKKTVWWGYSSSCNLILEVILTSLTDFKKNDWFIKNSLPKIKISSKNEDTLWQIFSARFLIPSGYQLKHHRLTLGDITLDFIKSKTERLLVRQVYPAKLALDRRPLPGWLRDVVFKRHRRFKATNDDKSLHKKSRKTGFKALPFPLGWIKPLNCERLIVEDRELDRLYIIDAEWDKNSKAPLVDKLASEMGKRVA
jgi:hypothetical protein